MMNVRQATVEDEAQILALFGQFSSNQGPDAWVQSAAPTLREVVQNEELGTVLVAEEDGNLFGVITLSYPVAIRCAGIYSLIEEFIVSEGARGKGVGGQLLKAAVKEATRRNCYEIQVNRPSELGYPVYLEHGFKDMGKHLLMRLPRQVQMS
jgi:GNAT superfamily N-acetyltransferase